MTPQHVLVLTGAADSRDRAALLTPVLNHASVVVQVHRMPTGGDVDCRSDLPHPDRTPDCIVLFHGGLNTAARIKALRARFNCPIVLRVGGRNDLAALDLARGAIGSLRMGKALRHVANAALDRRALRVADGCICVTEALSMWVHGCTDKPVITCPPVRQLPGDAPPHEVNPAPWAVLTISNLQYRAKVAGALRLLPLFEQLAAEVPKAAWRIVGSGAGVNRLHQRTRRSVAHDRITLAGWSDDVQGELLAAGQFWYASTLDAYPLSVSEAMWQGVPVLVEQRTPAAAMVPACAAPAKADWVRHAVALTTSDALRSNAVAQASAYVRDRESPERLGGLLCEWIQQVRVGFNA